METRKTLADMLPLFEEPSIQRPFEKRQDNATHDIPARAAMNARAQKPKVPLDQAAQAFIDANPQVWTLFVDYTRQLIARGHERIGVALVFERLRWEAMMRTTDPEGFKLNNNHRAYFARKFMREYPQYGHPFSLRGLAFEKAAAL